MTKTVSGKAPRGNLYPKRVIVDDRLLRRGQDKTRRMVGLCAQWWLKLRMWRSRKIATGCRGFGRTLIYERVRKS